MKASTGEAESTRTSLELLYNISREMTSALDLQTVLQRVLLLSMNNVGAQSGSLIVLDEAGDPVESAIVVGDRFIEHSTSQYSTQWRGMQGRSGWKASRIRAPGFVSQFPLRRQRKNDASNCPRNIL